MKTFIRQTTTLSLLGIILFALQLFAFTEPSSSPPSGNVSAPLNISSSGQSKSGGLILNTGGAANGLIVDQGNVGIGTQSPTQKLDVIGYIRGATGLCIGGDCRTSWPSGGIQSEQDTLQSVTERGNSTNQSLKIKNVSLDVVTGSNPTCPTGGFLTRKFVATTCNFPAGSCTTGSGWSTIEKTCTVPDQPVICGDGWNNCITPGGNCPANWTESVCMGN